MLDGSFGVGGAERRKKGEEDYERKPEMQCSLLMTGRFHGKETLEGSVFQGQDT